MVGGSTVYEGALHFKTFFLNQNGQEKILIFLLALGFALYQIQPHFLQAPILLLLGSLLPPRSKKSDVAHDPNPSSPSAAQPLR